MTFDHSLFVLNGELESKMEYSTTQIACYHTLKYSKSHSYYQNIFSYEMKYSSQLTTDRFYLQMKRM